MKYRFHPDALEEYLEAIRFYADESAGLGEAFVDEVEKSIAQILSYPQIWPCLSESIRRCLLKRFPFGIYYTIEGHLITIYAIIHLSRHPDHWKHRIE